MLSGMSACAGKMCCGDVLRGITGGVTGQTPTKGYRITELVGVFLVILLWFRSRDLLKYLSIVLW